MASLCLDSLERRRGLPENFVWLPAVYLKNKFKKQGVILNRFAVIWLSSVIRRRGRAGFKVYLRGQVMHW